MDRIEKLVQGYLEQTIDPDKVKSEPIPKKNPGPLFTAVADNLMQTVMQPDADVVIHFYSRADDSWEDHEFELEKFAEATEDIKSLKVSEPVPTLTPYPSSEQARRCRACICGYGDATLTESSQES